VSPHQTGGDALADRPRPGGKDRGQRGGGQQIQRVLLGELGQQGGDLLQRSGPPLPAVRVDAEVEPVSGPRRVDDPVGDRRLHRDVLEVAGAGVEQQREFPVVDRHLAEHGCQRPKPEREARAFAHQLPAPLVAYVHRGGAAQVSQKGVALDVSHRMVSLSSGRR
jgi:hypothetical protein